MPYRQSLEGCLSASIGKAGLDEASVERWLSLLAPGFDGLRRSARERSLAHFRVLDAAADIEETRAAYDTLAEGAETIVMLGTGGSSLGGQAIAELGGWSIPGDNGPSGARRPRLRFYDNLDARSFMTGLSILDWPRTRFVVISKSGGTAETLAQTLIALAAIEAAGHGSLIPKQFLGITEPERAGTPNGLRTLFAARGIPMLPHDIEIGGRYSVFTNVGMIAAFARGLDFSAFRRGARHVVSGLEDAASPKDFAPAIGAAIAIGLAMERGIVNSVLMAYSDRLRRFSAWYVQLWAESLGKGGKGTTPIAALGPVDQHSQLQLFMDGAPLQCFTILRVLGAGGPDGPPISQALAAEARAAYLAGHSIGDLVRAQQRAIADALVAAARPVRTIDCDRLDEYTLGALMMHFMIETILAADLLGVDPFDQPAVELGKRLTRDYLAQTQSPMDARG